MTFGFRVTARMLATALLAALVVGCGHTEGKESIPGSVPTITLGKASTDLDLATVTSEVASNSSNATATNQAASLSPTNDQSPADSNVVAVPATTAGEVIRTFKVEGPEDAIRVSFDDFDLLKVMNLDPVPADAPERLPKWLKALDGKRIRVRGFMYPPFQDTDIRGFVLARDNQICCFGRTPKEYDLVDIFLRKGVSTHYIQNRPFDVVGLFKIKSEIEKYTAMYELEDAIVIEK